MEPFTITFVCTGNRFRSPLAEAFVRQLTLGLPVRTDSYGTLQEENAPAMAEAVEIALSCGVSLENHRSRYVSNASLEHVDLVVGFEAEHVQQAVVDARAPREKTFTLGDLVPLLPRAHSAVAEEDVVERARSLVAAAADLQKSAPGPMSGMRDPFGASWKVQRQTGSDIRDLSLALVESLFGAVDTQALPPIPEKLGRRRRALWR